MSETELDRNTLGGWSTVNPVTLEVIKICFEVKQLIQKRVEKENDLMIYNPLLYASQIVNGTNYVVKVLLSLDGLCVHMKIYQSLDCDGAKLSLIEIQFPKTFDDPLIPF
ncbi:Cystatin-B [Labeo rohita]|uniref:Cystatin-B n=1 Tax=Labeo rohita TaxID=84645 RepID=A0ABQ8L735_LABRO|nr:cystatin-B isoform X1 [Labeo rohita]KAI2646553.1 Cystatin-B [Labeo rohita]